MLLVDCKRISMIIYGSSDLKIINSNIYLNLPGQDLSPFYISILLKIVN